MACYTKRIITGLAAASLLVGSASADFLLDDLEHGTNQHKMEQYWYYYVGDNAQIMRCESESDPGRFLTNVTARDKFGFVFEPYTGTAANSGNAVAALMYTNLDYADGEYGEDTYPVVGMGMLLTGDDDKGMGSAFNAVTAIEFYMKADDVDTVIFKVETTENSPTGPYGWGGGDAPCGTYFDPDPNPANAWMVEIEPTSSWQKYTIQIADATGVTGAGAKPSGPAKPAGKAGDLQQQPWWGIVYEFKKANATKIAWQINNDKNTSKSGAVYIDDIKLIGNFTYVPADQCHACVGQSRPSPSVLFSDFEDDNDPLRNALGWYWYAYDDSEAGGSSFIENYWTVNPHTEAEVLDVSGNGKDGAGPAIEYVMGGSFTDSKGTLINSFVGIGANLYDDSTGGNYFNASANGVTGIYFEYKTSFDNESFISVEFSDKSDVEFAAANGDDGEVFYRKVPGTGGEWKTAVILFDSLVLPPWVSDPAEHRRVGTSLDRANLGKIQFKYEGVTSGGFALDNVYFTGTDKLENVSVKRVSSKAARAAGIRATYNRGTIGVNWNAPSQIRDGKISLINIKGRTVASSKIRNVSGNKISANLGAGKLPTGMYFVRINARDVNGKRVVQQVPISVVK